MEAKKTESTPLRAVLANMEVGDIIEFPAKRTSVVRSTASILSLELERSYSTKTYRESRTIKVLRTA